MAYIRFALPEANFVRKKDSPQPFAGSQKKRCSDRKHTKAQLLQGGRSKVDMLLDSHLFRQFEKMEGRE
eukprot:12163520-Alexandrium_andersonii.AAC.1